MMQELGDDGSQNAPAKRSRTEAPELSEGIQAALAKYRSA